MKSESTVKISRRPINIRKERKYLEKMVADSNVPIGPYDPRP